MSSGPLPPALYLVATPIGNLEDITLRALRVLQAVDLVAAEDTRHTGHLLRHYQIDTPQLSYHDHNHASRLPELLERLHSGQRVALVSDAGMPTIADPGLELVQACAQAQIPVVPIPGPSAVVTVLGAAGLAATRFCFEGFLPPRGQERQQRLAALGLEERTMVLYEAPHRLVRTLADLVQYLGAGRGVVVGRELTKIYEQFWRGDLQGALDYFRHPCGEFTLVVAGASPPPPPSSEHLKNELTRLIRGGMSRSQASRHLAQEVHLPRQRLYQLALEIPLEVDLP